MPRVSRKDLDIIIAVLRNRVAADRDASDEVKAVLHRIEQRACQSKDSHVVPRGGRHGGPTGETPCG